MNSTTNGLLASMAKTGEDLRKRLDRSDAAKVQDDLEKRAETDLAHLPGSTSDRAALLKAIDGIEDEGQRNSALAALKVPEGRISTAPPAGSPDAELAGLAKAYQSENPGVTIEAATAAILRTETGAMLYAKSLN